MPCHAPALLRQCRVLRESLHGGRKYPTASLAVQQIVFFVVCCYHSFPRPGQTVFFSHWPPASEIGMRLITTFVELRVEAGRRRTRAGSPQAVLEALLCRGLENNGMVAAQHGCGTARVDQTRPYCVNQMGKTHSKPLAAWHGRGTA